MFPSVLASFEPFSTKFEGYLPYLYLDNEGLVTTGMGNLVDPVENALNLPWTNPDGSSTSQSDIMAQWRAVKASGAAGTGGGNQAHLSSMRLGDDGIRALIDQKLTNNESILKRRIPQWDSLPADAQLGVLSMAWAMGANFNYPKFMTAINALVPDWDTMVTQCWMPDNANHSPNSDPPNLNPGLRPRNLANQQLFRNAQQAVSQGLDPSELIYDVGSAIQSSIAYGTAAAGAAGAIVASHPVRSALVFTAWIGAAGAGAWWLADPDSMKAAISGATAKAKKLVGGL